MLASKGLKGPTFLRRHARNECGQIRSSCRANVQLASYRTREARSKIMKTFAVSIDSSNSTAALNQPEEDNSTFLWSDAWYPLGLEQDFFKDKPNGSQLLGKGVVVWFDPLSKSWKAFRDLCPHRLIPLSEGRINEAGLLECGYHGWTFSAGGECQTVPQAPAGSVGHRSARACVEAYPCAVRQGLIWVRPTPISKVMAAEGGGLGEEKIPTADEVREEDGWVFRTVVRDLPYDYATLLENVLDVSHVPFTHHGTVGNRANATAVDLEITQRSRDGFEGLWREGPRNGRYGPQLSRFRAPIMMEHSLNALDTLGFATKTVVYAVPQAPGRCRVIARIPWKFKSPIPRLVFALLPGWATHPNENLILEDDQLFLHQQERELAMLQQQNPGTGIGGLYYMPTSADAFVNAFRTWVAKTGGGGPFGRLSPEEFLRAIGPRQTEEQLLDRYHSHTKHCRSCSAALEFVERTQTVLRVLSPAMILVASLCAAAAAGATSAPAAAVALSLPLLGQVGMVAAPSLWTASGVLGAGGLVAWVVAMALERYRSSFLVGTYPPPRNYKK